MRTFTSLTAGAILIASLSACSKSEPAPEASESAAADAMAPEAAATWTPALPAAGTYDVSSTDGKAQAKVTIAPDNAYSREPVEGANEAGVVKLTDGKVCFDPSGDQKPTHCYVESVRAADGSFTATGDDSVTVNVKPAAM
ncbi:MAG: hypothetical protein KDE32_13945 [Novosphingobium sp.]|nr:hypothetical protein [Novosphingobium sp.]